MGVMKRPLLKSIRIPPLPLRLQLLLLLVLFVSRTSVMAITQCVRSFVTTAPAAYVFPTTTTSHTRILHHRPGRRGGLAQGASFWGRASPPTTQAAAIRTTRSTISTTTSSRLVFSSTNSLESSSSSTGNNNNNEKKRIVFLGTPDVAAACLEKIHQASLLYGNNNSKESAADCNFEVVRVVTQPPKRRKRNGSKLEPSPVAQVAERLSIPIMCPEKANQDDFLTELEHTVRPHLCITAAYGQYLPKRFLATPLYGTMNIHPSLLPKWRGASPVQRSLQAGDNPVGVTVLFTVAKMDAGPIIAQQEQLISDETDTATTVLPMLFDLGTTLLLDALPQVLSGKITMANATPQDESKVVNAAMIHSAEAELKVWQESAVTCHNKLRGFSMWPGAFMYLKVGGNDTDNDKDKDHADRIMKVKVTQTRVVPRDENNAAPVELTDKVVLGPTKKSGLYVVCYDGSILELLQVQPATRKAFAARDFQNGYPGETIRWVQTPPDQLEDPAKYNSRS